MAVRLKTYVHSTREGTTYLINYKDTTFVLLAFRLYDTWSVYLPKVGASDLY